MSDRVIVDRHITNVEDLRDLVGGEVVDCTLAGLPGEEVSLDGIRFEGCSFVDCHLRLATLRGTRLTDTTFLRCNLTGVDWTKAEWPQFSIGAGLRLAECTLDYCSFAGLALPDMVAYDCRAIDVDFGGCDLTGADLRFSDLTDARLDGATLIDADLSGATGYSWDHEEVRSRRCVVSMPEAGAILQRLGLVVQAAPIQERAEDILRRR